MGSSRSTAVSSDVHLACRLASLCVAIASVASVVLQGPLTPPLNAVGQIILSHPKTTVAASVSQKVARVAQTVIVPQHVTEPRLPSAPQQTIAAPSQEKAAVQKGHTPARAWSAPQKRLAKKLGGSGTLTLETYTRCVARALDVDEPLAVSVLIQESDARNPMRRGSRGSRGPLQVQPIALEEVGLSRHERSLPILVYGGLRYLKTMMSRFDNLQTALAAYNMGPTSLVRRDYRPYRVTQKYVRQVLNRAGKIRSGDVPAYPVLQYPLSHRDLPSRHHKIAPLHECLIS